MDIIFVCARRVWLLDFIPLEMLIVCWVYFFKEILCSNLCSKSWHEMWLSWLKFLWENRSNWSEFGRLPSVLFIMWLNSARYNVIKLKFCSKIKYINKGYVNNKGDHTDISSVLCISELLLLLYLITTRRYWFIHSCCLLQAANNTLIC